MFVMDQRSVSHCVGEDISHCRVLGRTEAVVFSGGRVSQGPEYPVDTVSTCPGPPQMMRPQQGKRITIGKSAKANWMRAIMMLGILSQN